MSKGNYHFSDRNDLAKKAIARAAADHRLQDTVLGLGGFLPIPGAGPMSIAAQVGAGLSIYQGLARELAAIYEFPRSFVTKCLESGGYIALEAGSTIGVDLAHEFTVDFLTEIAHELLPEMGAGVVLSWIPIVGGAFSIWVGRKMATRMTWIVGGMIVLYYQNGGKWINSRQQTRRLSKDVTADYTDYENVDFNKNSQKIPELFEFEVERAFELAMPLFDKMPTAMMSQNQVRDFLRELQFSDEVIERALQRVADEIAKRKRDQ